MVTGVSRIEVSPGKLEAALALLVDRERGIVLGTTFRDSEELMTVVVQTARV